MLSSFNASHSIQTLIKKRTSNTFSSFIQLFQTICSPELNTNLCQEELNELCYFSSSPVYCFVHIQIHHESSNIPRRLFECQMYQPSISVHIKNSTVSTTCFIFHQTCLYHINPCKYTCKKYYRRIQSFMLPVISSPWIKHFNLRQNMLINCTPEHFELLNITLYVDEKHLLLFPALFIHFPSCYIFR